MSVGARQGVPFVTPPTESASGDAPTLGPWRINAQPFWLHGGKRFVVIMWWLAGSLFLMLGSLNASLPRPVQAAIVDISLAMLLVPGAAALLLWGLASRTDDEAKRSRLGKLAWKAVGAMIFLLMASVTGAVLVGVAFNGWTPPPLGVAIAFGFIVVIGVIFGALGSWAWLLASKKFEIGKDWLLPTSYGVIRHKGRRIPLAEVMESVLYVAGPSPTREGPPRFYWRFETGALGDCDVDSDVLEEARLSEADRGAVLERVIQVNATRGGKSEVLKDRTEEDAQFAESVMKAEAAQAGNGPASTAEPSEGKRSPPT